MAPFDHRGKRLDEPEWDDEPAEPEFVATCPNCGTYTAIEDGVSLYCITCGAWWSSTAHILTPEEERAMMEAS
jgi:hypothetical protein